MKRHGLLFLIICISLFLNCKEENQDVAFTTFKANFLENFWEQFPEWGIFVGYNKYATKTTVPNLQYFEIKKAFCQDYLNQLKRFKPHRLTIDHQTDVLMIENTLNKQLWTIDIFKPHEWNPAQYNVANVLNTILLNIDLPLEKRLNIIATRMDNLDVYYKTAKNNIQNPTKLHTNLAILQHEGTYAFFNQQLVDSLQVSTLSEKDQTIFLQKTDQAKLTIKDYLAFLKSWLNNENVKDSTTVLRDFRIGKSLFEQKFKYDIVSSYSATTIYEKALTQKKALHQKMIGISHKLWEKYFPKVPKAKDELMMVSELIAHLSNEHVKPAEYIKAIRTQIPELANFVKAKNILDLDAAKPLNVRPTPKHQRGFAGASITAPGPYNKTVPTYYNVTPLDGFTPKQAESYLREYNKYVMQLINIHEAIPGHYAQLVQSNQSPNIIKSVFGNGTMIEGWAVYAERMMLEEGYKNTPEMWLFHYKMNLRVAINTIIDYGIHVLDMSEAEAMDLMLREGFQEHSEALGKWQRATLSQVQLCSYFTGGLEVMELRNALKAKEGGVFDLKTFHQEFLSYGSAPIPYVRKLMVEK